MPEVVVDQNQKSQSKLIPLNSKVGQAPLTSVQRTANDLWATLSEKDTGTVYQQAATKTWKLLKQTLALLFFLWMLLAAVIIWIWGIGFRSGLQFRTWLEVKQPTLNEIISAMLQFLLVWPLKGAVEWANEFVKKYLGWEVEFNPIESEPGSPSAGSSETESPETPQPSSGS
jgi:hypothetical protein